MSQAAKQLITIILVVLFLAAAGVSVITTLQNQKLNREKSSLSKQVDEYRTRELSQITVAKNLQDKLDSVEKEKNDLIAKINSVGGNIDEVASKVKSLTQERDDLKKRYDAIQKERDDLTTKLAEKSKAMAIAATQMTPPVNNQEQIAKEQTALDEVKPGSADDEDYWARILKAKTALKMDLEKVKDDLAQSALQISDLKKQNSDLQLEISKLNTDKEAIAREIKYGNDLAKNLSIELARAQGEKQFMSDRMEKILSENTNLHEKLKSLTGTKVALEKNISKLQGDKKQIEGKLIETEGVIQSRVEQIYQLKDSLERDFKPAVKNPATGEIELSPIIVNSKGKGVTEVKAPPAGFNGSVVSINDENNFVIVNLGEDSGVKIGDKLNIYRGSQYIAGLEVIQVRKDISAADIKNKMLTIEVGDSVK